MTSLGQRRVVITGLGIVSPLGESSAAHWENLLAGRRGVRWMQPAELSIPRTASPAWQAWAAAPCAGVSLPAGSEAPDQMALSAAREALGQACLLQASAE